jgi:hypothetical protein
LEALRKVVNGNEIPNSFGIPESFKKRKLEVIIIPLEEESSTRVELKKPGALEAFKRPEMIEKEKTAWEIAMRDKHENS